MNNRESFHPAIFNRHGQSIVEYSLLIVLVLGSVIVMGPYVIRSWNANVKGWEDSYKDSYQDPLIKPFQNLKSECRCEFVKPCVDDYCCGYGDCRSTEASEVYRCDPIGCEPRRPSRCEAAKECCSVPIPAEIPASCGTLGCEFDEVPARFACGTDDYHNPQQVICQPNPRCLNQCIKPPLAGDPFYEPALCLQDDSGLEKNLLITFVKKGECSAPVGSFPKCQWECAPGFVPDEKKVKCICPQGYIRKGDQCVLKFFEEVSGDCYTDTPALDKIDGKPGCYRGGCFDTDCDFEHKTFFSVGNELNFTKDAYLFRNPRDWKVAWAGDPCSVISGAAGNWCQMDGAGSWSVTAWVTHLPTGTNKKITIKGTDRTEFSCKGCQ